MTFRKVVDNFERFFDKNLTDLVRGIRNNKENEAKYIAQCIEEIKEELKQDNAAIKSNAVAKLTYLQMLGYDMSWAAFNIIEVMSSTKFTHKRIGYLAASQCFNENTEVIMLTTNMIKKDLNSQNMYDAGCAMSSLSCFVSTDLSHDLANDIMTLLSSTKPYLRKKAVLLMFKIFLKYPEALKPAFPRLKEKLEDPDPGVQSAAVNVICELARKNPKNYLSLAPIFFKIMGTSTNNWMLIKIIKLFGSLMPIEPRLGKKLLEPLTNIIHSTSAMSLLYECVNTIIAILISISNGLPYYNSSIQLCVQKLRILIEDSDQNLKYLGLLAMSKILKTHPKSVQAHKDLVLACLDDKDESIRLRALDLLYGMVSKKNLMEVVEKLMKNMSESQLGNKYRDELLSKIIDICSQNDYQFIVDFEWYLSVLIDLTRVEGGTSHGTLISQKILDVAIRVESIRKFATNQMAIIIDNSYMFISTSVCEVLYAASWICGEFVEYLPDKQNVLFGLLVKQSLPAHIESIFIHNACKIYSKICEEEKDTEKLKEIANRIIGCLDPFLVSEDLEVQERATNFLQIVKISLEPETTNFASIFYAYPLNPVASIAQQKVPVPQELLIDEPFRDAEEEVEEVNHFIQSFYVKDNNEDGYQDHQDYQDQQDQSDQQDSKYKDTKHRQLDRENNPHYLKTNKKRNFNETDVICEPDSAEEAYDFTLKERNKNFIPGLASSEAYAKKSKESRKKSKKSKKPDENQEEEDSQLVTIKGLEMPEGAEIEDPEPIKVKKKVTKKKVKKEKEKEKEKEKGKEKGKEKEKEKGKEKSKKKKIKQEKAT